jgi:uncharacterized protein HemX
MRRSAAGGLPAANIPSKSIPMPTTAPDAERSPSGPIDGAATPPRAPAADARNALGWRALWLLFIVAVGAGGYALYQQWRTTETLRADVAQRLAAGDVAIAQSRARESDLANELRDAQAKLALLETRVSEFQSQQASLEALYRELAPSRDELALSEVEQILVLASQQLSLAGNVQAALVACRSPTASWRVWIGRSSRHCGERSPAIWIG